MGWIHAILLIPVVASAIFWSATVFGMARFHRSAPKRRPGHPEAPAAAVSILKPVCGLEKHLYENLASTCGLNYRPYEIIFTLHDGEDPAIKAVEKVKAACPKENIQIVVDEHRIGANGKISNLQNGLSRSAGRIVVISDSDMHLAPDYLDHLLAPFHDPDTGIACTLYRARRPDNFLEALELLSYNLDFVPSMVFAFLTGSSVVCPGASMAIRRDVLDAIGGLLPLRDHFVEDYELARRAAAKGYRTRLVPYAAKMDVEVRSWTDWWRHHVGWDLKTRCANKWGYFFTLLIRGVPFALLYAAAGGPYGGWIPVAVAIFRIVTGSANAGFLGDRDGLRWIWLLPVRDILGFAVWSISLFTRKTRWRGQTFRVKKGKLVAARGNSSS